MSANRPKTRRGFTVREANATLPLVEAIVKDLTELAREVVERRERLSSLPARAARHTHDPYREELAQVEEQLEKDTRRLRKYVEELLELGVEPRSVTQGLVDFPAMIDGRHVYLCWRLGESEVGYWHERDASIHQREPLAASGVARDVEPSSDANPTLS